MIIVINCYVCHFKHCFVFICGVITNIMCRRYNYVLCANNWRYVCQFKHLFLNQYAALMLCLPIQASFCIIYMRRDSICYARQLKRLFLFICGVITNVMCGNLSIFFILICGIITNVMCTNSSIFLYYLYAAL